MAAESPSLRIAQIVPDTEAEGPGRRFALWFQGCPLRCPGCCNPEMLPFEGGQLLSLNEVIGQLQESATAHSLEGITLLGGEPLAHAAAGAALAQAAHALGLNVMVFSGYLLEDARQPARAGCRRIAGGNRHSCGWPLCARVAGDAPPLDWFLQPAHPFSERPLRPGRPALAGAQYSGDTLA